jgi:phenylpropionate dioxygenase-like ring-hydroxylating dioxygenase large terminal subunit
MTSQGVSNNLDSPSSLAVIWREMQRRFVTHLQAGGTTDLDATPFSVDVSTYTDPERLAAERRLLFGQVPLLAAFSCELKEPGDKLCFDAAGPPILLVRAPDRTVKAYLNFCPHRGARLVNDCSRARLMTCPFHGWTFDLDGELRGRPISNAFCEEGNRNPRLIPVPVAEWGGLIFVRAAPGSGSIDVEEFLGSFAPILRALGLEGTTLVKREVLPTVSTNWKHALDTYCEAYHVPRLHRQTLARYLIPNISIHDHFGFHHRYAAPGLECQHLVDLPEEKWPESHYQAVHYLFPNTTLGYATAIDGKTPVLSVFSLYPGMKVGETITLSATYKPSDSGSDTERQFEELHEAVRAIVCNEDYRMANESWPGFVHAPSGTRIVFGRNEGLLSCYHRDIAKTIQMPLT